MTNHTTYQDAGVDIESGNQLVDDIKPVVAKTKRPGADTNIGGFGGLFDLAACNYTDPVLVSATDGVGTKLHIAHQTNTHGTIGIDLVAMCVNDLIVQGAEPLFFLDYFATGKLDRHAAKEVITGIAEGCTQAGCALIGGETAEMPGLYKGSEYDLAGFAVGAVERHEVLPVTDGIQEHDVVLGLSSSGVHSNGFSLVRHVLKEQGIDYSDSVPFSDQTCGDVLLEPTKIYVKSCLNAIRTGHVKALAHITGGGFIDNIPRVLPSNLGVQITSNSWPILPVFSWIKSLGNIESLEMLKTFNCGIGMILVVAPNQLEAVQHALKESGEESYVIGHVTSRDGDAVIFDDIGSLSWSS